MLSERAEKSLRWLTEDNPKKPSYPAGTIAMNSAENWLVRPDILPIFRNAIFSNLEAKHLSYSKDVGGPEDLLRQTASFFNKFFAPLRPVQPEHIVVCAGASSALDTLDFAICGPNDGLLIEAPMWEEGFGIAGMLRNDDRLVPVDRPQSCLTPEHFVQHYRIAMEKAPCTIRGIIMCNPQNPQCHIYPTPWLEALLQFCEENDLHYISDEMYGLSTFGCPSTEVEQDCSEKQATMYDSPETTFTSVLSLDLKKLRVNPARVHLVYAISKDLGSSGLRLGFFVTQANPELRNALWIFNRYKVSNASCVMGTSLFSDLSVLETIININKRLLRNAAEQVCDFLSFHHISFYRPVAGCFIWARLGGESAAQVSDDQLLTRFVREMVSVAAGAEFHASEAGWFRITYALPPADLREGLARIEAALDTKRRWQPRRCQCEAGLEIQKASTRRKSAGFGCILM